MLSYLASLSFWGTGSGTMDSLRFRLSFRLSAAVEKTDSLSAGFSKVAGLAAGSVFGVMEKLGARGPLGFARLGFLFNSVIKLGLMWFANSPLYLGKDEETNGEIVRVLDVAVSNENDGRLGLSSLGARISSDLKA